MNLADFLAKIRPSTPSIGRKRRLATARTQLEALTRLSSATERIAAALEVVVYREYGLDLAAPPPSRAEMKAPIPEPVWSSDYEEAVAEEAERILALELDEASGLKMQEQDEFLTRMMQMDNEGKKESAE